MSAFGDYKSYKKYEPVYPVWKYARDEEESKRKEFLKKNPKYIDESDIQRGRALIHAIDIMDEYSQKRAEDMEVATETAVSYGLEAAIFGGTAIGGLVGQIKPVKKFLIKHFGKTKMSQHIGKALPFGLGAFAGIMAAFPMYTWAAKAEVAASRRGRFEAMRKELNHPNSFAVLTEEQIAEAQEKSKNIVLKDDKKNKFDITGGLRSLREMSMDSKDYKIQKKLFDIELKESEEHINDEMTPEEIENAKKNQQLLTKLVEKIDIASQDYAENTELATQTATAVLFALGGIFNIILTKVLKAAKLKSADKISAISQIAGISIPILFSVMSAQVQKQASRVGRFKIKQDLLNNPEKMAYVSEKDIAGVKLLKVEHDKKEVFFDFLTNIYKNNKEYNQYKKTKAKEEAKFYKAAETLELTPEQIKDAKILQRNTFKTFNKIDEMSQKYSESIEALGQAISFPISLFFTGIGAAAGSKFLINSMNAKSKLGMASGMSKYMTAIMLSIIPSIGINAYITKEQKKASRIADMLAINEMSDYRQFR